MIRLIRILKQKNKATYQFITDGKISSTIRSEQEFFIEYNFDISKIPDSILAIPFVANVIPIVWVYNDELIIDEIDEDFLLCLEDVRRTYEQMFPNLAFAGKFTVNRIISADIETTETKSLLFFSGGVDATSSLISMRKEKPLLCTIWGSDIYFHDKEGWEKISQLVENTANDFQTECTFIKSSFRNILNYEVLNKEIAKPNHENWRHGFQHGIAIISHAAPIAYYYKIRKIYIAASFSVKSTEDYVCASTPAIDNYVKFCGCNVLHEGFENSRNDKVRKICQYTSRFHKKIHLHVCWETRDGNNCCICEKCARTYMTILSEGYEPKDFGFNVDEKAYDIMLDKVKKKQISLSVIFWKDTINNLSNRPEILSKNPFAEYLVSKYPEYCHEKKKEMKTCRDMPSFRGIILERKQDFSTKESSFKSVGLNSGNLIFREALVNNLDLLKMSYEQYKSMSDVFSQVPIVVTDLIWINENSNFDYLFQRLEENKDVSFVPISVGLQSKSFRMDFKLNDSVCRVLSAMQERAVIGVRGEYTASILQKYGIHNIEVIGCPSLYYPKDPFFQIEKKNIQDIYKVVVNFRTMYGTLSREEKHFLTYCANRKYKFIEQTNYEFTNEICNDTKFFQYISNWLKEYKQIFFDAIEWKNYVSNFDFSMGARFHGNVVALWNKIPALFFKIDSRTEELINYFNLPSIKMSDFDDSKPIEYYYEKADYSKFNETYKEKYNKYQQFLIKNKLIQNQ